MITVVLGGKEDLAGSMFDFEFATAAAGAADVEGSYSDAEDWAREAGLSPTAFEAATAEPATRERLVSSKKEGLRNGVEATPTLFIDGRPYVGDLDLEELVDVIGEERDRVTGEVYGRP